MDARLPYFDAHAHISAMDTSAEVMERALLLSNFHVMNICTDLDSLREGKKLASLYPAFYNAGATVPTDVATKSREDVQVFGEAAKRGELSAIGETGLDYYHTTSTAELQKEFLRAYLHLAWELSLPLIFHCRNAFEDLFSFCDAEYGKKGGFPAMVHCFTGTAKEAAAILERGWMLSCSGIVTYPKQTLSEVLYEVPLTSLLVETDAPYLAPQGKRGRVNEPSYLVETVTALAKIKNISPEEAARSTFNNAVRFFSLEKDVAKRRNASLS